MVEFRQSHTMPTMREVSLLMSLMRALPSTPTLPREDTDPTRGPEPTRDPLLLPISLPLLHPSMDLPPAEDENQTRHHGEEMPRGA